MESLGIYETIIILSDRVEGLLARMDFLSNEMDNPKSDLRFYNSINFWRKNSKGDLTLLQFQIQRKLKAAIHRFPSMIRLQDSCDITVS